MSLYNALFGESPFADYLLAALGTTKDNVPRYRDCYLDEGGHRIVIHTRTGGGNRDYYESRERYEESVSEWDDEPDEREGPWNDDLRNLPGFTYDRDDDFDCTYADFYFEVPEAIKPQTALLMNLGAVRNPVESWQKLLDDLRNGESNDETKRALVVGEQVFSALSASMNKPEPTT